MMFLLLFHGCLAVPTAEPKDNIYSVACEA